MQNISNELIDHNEIQRLQGEFCKATGLCAYCLDSQGNRITEITGSDEQLRQIQEFSKQPAVRLALERVWEGSLEDLAIEDLNDDGDKIAAIAVRIGGSTVLYWLAFLIRPGRQAETQYFYDTLDLLQDTSGTLFANKMQSVNAAVEMRRNHSAEQELGRHAVTIDSMTEMLRFLDSDERVEGIMKKWLGILSTYLQVDSAQLYRLFAAEKTMDVVTEWLAPGETSVYDRTSRLPVPSILKRRKPIITSFGGNEREYLEEIRKQRLQAVIVLPVIGSDDTDVLMLSLNHRKHHVWSQQEIKFAGDAVRVLQSVISRRTQKNALSNTSKALEMTLENVDCSIYVTDKKTGKELYANRQLRNNFAKELSDGSFENMLKRAISQGRSGGGYEIHHAQPGCWYSLIFKEISWTNGEPANLYSLYDITDKKLYQRRIEQQAYTDILTGLYNRMCCERDLARHVDEAKKTGKTGVLLYLDLDDFKHINEGLGHQYGDVLLKAISNSIQRVSGIEETCYRMGGDEFVVIIPPSRYNEWDRIVADISAIFERPWFLKDADYYCTMSMGSVTFPDMGDTVLDLVQKADIAMYEAKKSGKNRIVNYESTLLEASDKRFSMEKNMRDATAEGYNEFEVYYQPIIDMQAGYACAGAEALIRWNSNKLGFIPPEEFIPLAEYLGLINPIGNHVLKEACAQCRKWNDNGHPNYRVNVNLSVVQLLQADVVEIVERILQETGISPANLVLEVTESLAINDMVRIKDILNRIRALGVKIALDDFGTGYSSLSHIKEIPFDLLKVDQSFVEDLADDAYSKAFIKMAGELAETLNVDVCVEGVETLDQYNVIKNMNINYIQGFYFDRPLERAVFEQKYVANSEENM